MTDFELKPCPFCGRTPEGVTHSYNYQKDNGPWKAGWVVRHECAPGHGDSPESAAIKWNTRHD